MGWVVRLRGWKVRDGRRGWGGCGGSGSLKGLDEGARPVEGLWDEVRPWELSRGSTWLCLNSGGEAPNLHPPGEQNFIKSLIHFDKDNISDKVLKKMNNARIFGHINVIYPFCTIVVTYFNSLCILSPTGSYCLGSSLMCMNTHTYTHSHTQLFWLFFPSGRIGQ